MSLSGTVTGVAAPNLTLNSTTVATNANTAHGGGYHSLADLNAGDNITVTGSIQADGSFLASNVTKQTITVGLRPTTWGRLKSFYR